jgi:hypothetical protein
LDGAEKDAVDDQRVSIALLESASERRASRRRYPARRNDARGHTVNNAPDDPTMSFQYQVTFDDYREAVSVQTSTALKQIRREKRIPAAIFFVVVMGYVYFTEFAAPTSGGFAHRNQYLFEIAQMLALPTLLIVTTERARLSRRRSHLIISGVVASALSFALIFVPKLLDHDGEWMPREIFAALNPGIVWCGMLVYFLVAIARNHHDNIRRLWDGQAHLQGIKTILFDHDGVTLEDATYSARYRWLAVQRMVETSHVLLLYIGGLAFLPISKRDVPSEQIAELKALVQTHVESRGRAFPVLPVGG